MKHTFLFKESLGCQVIMALANRLIILLFILLCPVLGFAQLKQQPKSFSLQSQSLNQVERKVLGKVNVDSLVAADQKRGRSASKPEPLRFAVTKDVSFNSSNSGTWQNISDGRLWRLRIYSPGALSNNLGITRFAIPEGAKLWIYNPAHEQVEGPYTSRDKSNKGSLWSPVIVGDEIVVELFIPTRASQPEIEISKVNRGYLDFQKAMADKSGSCNNNVICSEGDPWRNQIRSVARYTINGNSLCTGQLVNNTAQDRTPYFLSANHCGVTTGNDDTLVFYWNFQSTNCTTITGSSLANNQTGATFRASYAPSDFLLVELDPGEIQAVFNVYFSGWDVSGTAPSSTVCIHHPSGDEKSISFNTNAVTSTNYLSSSVSAGGNHWRVDDWEDGTTEPGSSGSGLWDASTRRIVGQLHGGYSSCSSFTDDWYGKLSVSWTGGGTNDTRLRNWLDPGGTGTLAIDGDPHITTLDGTHYDFQGAGEFVVLRDKQLGEVQVRQTPVATSFNPGADAYHGLATCVSLNTAVAVRMGKHRITYQPNINDIPDPSGLQLRVDGILQTVGPQGMYLDGGRISKTVASGGIEITFPEKYVLIVTPGWWESQKQWYLNISIIRTNINGESGASFTTDSLAVGGIGSSIAPNSWLPRLPSGQSMGPMPSTLHDRYVDLYQKFGNAWRVTNSTSLFDYAQGKSTSDYTHTSWPSENPPCNFADMIPNLPITLIAAQSACAQITDTGRRSNCVFDVQITGELSFASTYLLAQKIEDNGTNTTIIQDKNPSQHNEAVSFIATVIPLKASERDHSKPSGTIQFTLNGKNVGSPVKLDANGHATFTTSMLPPGNHKLAAIFTPASSSHFLESSSVELSHTVIELDNQFVINGTLVYLTLGIILILVFIWWLLRRWFKK
jgi:lysyl endopeptidase